MKPPTAGHLAARDLDNLLAAHEHRMHSHRVLLEILRGAAFAAGGDGACSVVDFVPAELFPPPPAEMRGLLGGEVILLSLALSIAEAYQELARAASAALSSQEQQQEAA